MRYGDDLFAQQNYCKAYEQYQTASGLGNLDNTAAANSNKAFQQCYPPTAIAPTAAPTVETAPAATDVPIVPPTEVPAP